MREIERTRKSGHHLSTVFLIGGTAELILRELADDERTGSEKLIAKLQKLNVINSVQAELFDEIRERRNKYLHVNANKILSDNQYFYVDKDGLLDNINEIALSDYTEENLRKTLTLHIRNDAHRMMDVFRQLVHLLTTQLDEASLSEA